MIVVIAFYFLIYSVTGDLIDYGDCDFQSDSLVQSADIYLSDHNVYIPLLITPENLCWTLPCPVKTSKYVKLNGNFTIPENAFKSKGELRWFIFANGQTQAACIKTAINLVRSSKNL